MSGSQQRSSSRRTGAKRQYLAAVVIACCTTSIATAQALPAKSARFFKTTPQDTQVRSSPAETAAAQSASESGTASASQPAPVQPAQQQLSPSSRTPPSPSGQRKSARSSSGTTVPAYASTPPEPAPAQPRQLGSKSPAFTPSKSFTSDPSLSAPSPIASTPVEVSASAMAPGAAIAQDRVERFAPHVQQSVQSFDRTDASENVLRQPAERIDVPGQPPALQANRTETWEEVSHPSDVSIEGAECQLTLAVLEEMALVGNPSLGRASAAVAAARGAAVQAGLPLNPTVGYEGQQIGSGGQAEQHGLLVSQEFLRHEKRTLSREVAAREVQMAEYRFMAQRARVLTDVRIAYYRALRAQRQLDMNNELLHIAEQAFKAAQALAEAKEIARTDVLQAQIEVEVAKNALNGARNQLQSAWSQMAAVTGQSQLPIAPLAGDLFAPGRELEFDAVLAWLRGRSPEIAVAAANIERARLYWERQRAEPRPNLAVQSLYNFVDNGIGGKPDAAVAVSVPVPVHNRNQGAIQQARYQIVEAERALSQLELALQQRLAPVYERYRNAQNSVTQYAESILPSAAEVLRLTQKTFEVGEIGFTNLLIAQRSYRQQQLAYLDAAEALRVAESEIDGLLLSNSLSEPTPP